MGANGKAKSPQPLENKQNSVCHSGFRKRLSNQQAFFESLSRYLDIIVSQ